MSRESRESLQNLDFLGQIYQKSLINAVEIRGFSRVLKYFCLRVDLKKCQSLR